MKKIAITLVCILVQLLPLFAEKKPELQLETIDNRQGLPWNEVRRIHKDQEGFMWFSTYLGLVRYDGYEFEIYRNTNENPDLLTSNFITTINDDERRIWIGTDYGLNYIRKSDKTVHKIDMGEASYCIVRKIIRMNDTLWIGTSKGLFNCYDESGEPVIRRRSLNSRKGLNNIEDLLLDSKGRLWIGAHNNGLIRYDPSSGNFLSYPAADCEDFAHKIYEDHDGEIWVGTWGRGLVKIENSYNPRKARYKYYRYDKNDSSSISSDVIYAIQQDRFSKDLWIGHRGGLSILREKNVEKGIFDNYTYDGNEKHLSNNDVSDLYQDESGMMWLATIGGGIQRKDLSGKSLSQMDISRITQENSCAFITALYKDNLEHLWIGLKNKGLAILDLKTGEYRMHHQIPALRSIPKDAKIQKLMEINHGTAVLAQLEGNGMVWIQLKDGRITSSRLLTRETSRLVRSKNISILLQDSKNRIWISNGDHVTVTDSLFNEVESMAFPQTQWNLQNTGAEDFQGNIWLGSDKNGITRLSPEEKGFSIKEYNVSNGNLINNTISDMMVDGSGNLWVSTLGGGLWIYHRNKDKFVCQNSRYNIPYWDLFNLFTDPDGNVWGCTHNAILKFGSRNKMECTIFGSGSSIWNNVFHTGTEICMLDNDTFSIGGMNGISIFKPHEMKTEEQRIPTAITDIHIGYSPIFRSSCPKGCSYSGNELILNKKNNTFSVKFAALGFSDEAQIQYSYRLKGHDRKWTTAGTEERLASYTNLPKGKYTFEVRSSTRNAQWNEDMATLAVTVKPGIYESWYAFLLYALLILGLLYAVKRLSDKRLKAKHQSELEEMEKDKENELTRSKLRFFTNISHEFLTPLTIIGCSLENIEPTDKNGEDSKGIIKNNVLKLRNLIKEILDFNKAETGKLELKVADSNLAAFIRAICENDFRVLAEQKNIELTYSIPSAVKGWYDADKIDKIMTNLLSNAFKYNYENSYINVTLKEDFDEDQRYAIIRVKDGGVGIAPEKISQIFNRFYENDFRETKKEGIGIGLALTKSLVELHKGKISVESIPGKGTEFTVVIPINEGAYSETERKPDTKWFATEREATDALTGKRLLIVEDNAELRYVMSQYLSKYYVVDEASNGKEALGRLEDCYYDLVITDVMMPEMDGNELCREIKGNLEYSEIPVLMLTAKSSEQARIEGYDNGADAFMTKPFQMPLLVSRIDNLLKGREQMKQSYTKGDGSIQINALAYTTLDEQFMQKAMDLVDQNIANEDFNLDDFISEMNVSKSTLYRKIKTLTGMSCSEFIKDIRLKKAYRIMQEKSMTVAEISYQVGFGQPKYFTYCFKKKYGLSPSEFMNKSRQVKA